MSDLYAINLNLQERLERDWREKVRAAEAAVWLDDAGLLRNYKNGLPLRRLLRKGRIAGQEQRPNQKNGSWGIRHLAESRDSIAIQQVRQSMRRYLPIDQDILHTDWPLSRDNSGFWEELGRATVTQSTPSQLSGASSAVRTSRNPTTQGSRVSISPQRSAPPACRPARLRTLVSGATGDCFSAPFPTSISAARSGLAPPRELAPGDERRIRRCMARAAIPHIRATHYAPSDAGRSASGRQSSCAPYRSPVPDSPVRTPAKCLWTGRAYWLSSVSSVQRTGTEMVCIGMATYRHRTEVRTPGRLDARRDYSGPVRDAHRAERFRASRGCEVLVCRMDVPRKADSRTGGGARTGRRRRQRRDDREDHTMRKKVRGNNRLCRFSGGANPSPTALFYSR